MLYASVKSQITPSSSGTTQFGSTLRLGNAFYSKAVLTSYLREILNLGAWKKPILFLIAL